MGQYAISNEATAEVVAAPGFSIEVLPVRAQAPEGDLDMVARFKVQVVREAGYEKPIYLLPAGTSEGELKLGGVSIMVADRDYGLLPADQSECDLEFDFAEREAGYKVTFVVGGYEDPPEAVA